ncbi:uncharacterized protein [Haliotis asinina]|uniref:uncharacterized protein n=1 Tax=Haliotis asinina TaxID=109174 RepID=UPI0035323B44
MGVSTIILFSLLVCGVKAIDIGDSLAALATRMRLLEGGIQAWKVTAVNAEIKLMNKFEVLESSLKEELTGRFLPPLITSLVKLAISDIMEGDYIGNIISGHVLEQLQTLKTIGQQTKTQLKGVIQQLRRVELDRDAYRKSHRKQRNRLTKDIRALQVQLNHTVADLGDARRMNSDTKRKIIGVTEDFIALNTSSVMVRNEVESCMDGLQEIRLKLPTDIHSLTTQLNQTKEDLVDTKGIISDLTKDLMALNTSCGVRIKPSDRNETSLTASSSLQMSLTTTAVSTDQSNTVPPAPLTTQHSDAHASTTDSSEDLTPSSTVLPAPETTQASDAHASTYPSPSNAVPPAPLTTQHSDAHATPSPAAGRNLSNASIDGDLERVKQIVAAGHVDINYRERRWSRTPLMEAALNGQGDVVEFLVGRGADVSLVDGGGDNFLHWACRGGHLETVKLILSMNVVDVNARNSYGWTAVKIARSRAHQRVLDLLVSRGAH